MASVDTRKIELTEEDIENNKQRFISLLDFPNHKEWKKESTIKYLMAHDFFTAPASTIFHGCCKGGLCYHTLSVYDTLCKYIKMAFPDAIDEETGETVSTCPYSEESIRLVALFHDISKTDVYKEDYRNVKQYSDDGKKSDELGRFDWVAEKIYKMKEPEDRLSFGTHAETSLYMTRTFFPDLTMDEATAILHHMGRTIDWNDKDVAPSVYNKNPLALLLHQADEYSALYAERV